MSQGALTQFAAAASGTAVGSFDEFYEFLSENVAKQGRILESAGMRGTRSRHADRTRTGPYKVAGSVTMEPTPEDLDNWFPRILGAAESIDTFALADTLPDFALLFDRGEKRFLYDEAVVSRAVFRSSQGSPILQLQLDVEAKSEETSATAFPSASLSTQAPYIFSDTATGFTLGGSTRKPKEMEITIDNLVDTERFLNELTRSEIPAQDRLITVRVVLPYDSNNSDLYEQALAGAAGSIVFTHGGLTGVSTTFTFAKLQVPDNSPVVPGKQEVDLTLEMTARMTGSTKELEVTHDPVAA